MRLSWAILALLSYVGTFLATLAPYWGQIGLFSGYFRSVLAFVSDLGMSLSLNSGLCKAFGCAANNFSAIYLLLHVASFCSFFGMLRLGYTRLISCLRGGHGVCNFDDGGAGTVQGVGCWARVGTILGLSWAILGMGCWASIGTILGSC